MKIQKIWDVICIATKSVKKISGMKFSYLPDLIT